MKIEKVFSRVGVEQLRWTLRDNPSLWDTDTRRTSPTDSPHHGLSDIWVRYAAPEIAHVDLPHQSVWYPCEKVLDTKSIVMPLMAQVKGEQLGGVLITRIPPGGVCKPHKDSGWHAGYYDKFGVQIESAPGQRFCFDGESLETQPGDVFWFNNAYEHWVENPTDYERITMIVCIRLNKED